MEFKKVVEVSRAWEIAAYRYPVEMPSEVVLMLGTGRVKGLLGLNENICPPSRIVVLVSTAMFSNSRGLHSELDDVVDGHGVLEMNHKLLGLLSERIVVDLCEGDLECIRLLSQSPLGDELLHLRRRLA